MEESNLNSKKTIFPKYYTKGEIASITITMAKQFVNEYHNGQILQLTEENGKKYYGKIICKRHLFTNAFGYENYLIRIKMRYLYKIDYFLGRLTNKLPSKIIKVISFFFREPLYKPSNILCFIILWTVLTIIVRIVLYIIF